MVRPTPTCNPARPGSQAGFGFLTVLFLIILIGLALGQAGTLWSTQATRIKEADLLYVGEQYRSAIKAYYEAGSGAAQTYPRKLDDLLLDPRQPAIRRYLRKLYPDPLTGKPDWGLIADPVTQEIRGVYSRAPGAPLKTRGFPKKQAEFENARSYTDWRFETTPQDTASVSIPAASAPAAGRPPLTTPPPALTPAVTN
jgi:type II secretory pathway pseudopilin PulG